MSILEPKTDAFKVRRHYSRAPITEALIDIRVNLPSDVTVTELGLIHDQIRSEYPKAENKLHVYTQVSVGAQLGALARQELLGFAFSDNDHKRVAQALLGGFTFSRLAPYETWEELQDEGRRLWVIYRAVAKPTSVTRVAVRYINQIDIPIPMSDFRDYVKTIPEIPPELPQLFSDFYERWEIPQVDIGGHLILTQAMLPLTNDAKVCSVILDIDVFIHNAELPSDDRIWELLTLLRERKNEVFEACITDKTRELIN